MNRGGGAGQVVDLIEAAQRLVQRLIDVLRHQVEAIRTHQMSDVRVSTRVEIINAGHMMAGVNQSPA